MPSQTLNAKIEERIDLGAELAIFRIVPNGWVLPDFKAGQFTTIGLPASLPRSELADAELKPVAANKFIQRAYSIASAPSNKDYIEFYITLVRNGTLTPRLWNLKTGDDLYLSSKVTGHFIMDDVPTDRNILFVATGTGIAPFFSMLQTHLKVGHKRRFALFHGVRQSQDLGYRSEMLLLQKLYSRFRYFPILSRPHLDPAPWSGPVGHVQSLWQSKVIESAWGFNPTPEDTDIFLCGSPAMIDEMMGLLEKDGFKEDKKSDLGQVHVEKYW